MVEDYDESTGIATISQRNKFSVGEKIEVMRPMQPFFEMTVDAITDTDGNAMQSAPHAAQTLYIKLPQPACPGSMLRRKKA